MSSDSHATDALITHELRSPIATILGYQELLADRILDPATPRGADALDRIAHAARQLSTLVDGIDALSGSAAPPDPASLSPFDPAHLLRFAIEEVASDAAMRGIRLDADIEADVPPVPTEPDLLGRALQLVLHAALKSATGDTIAISLRQVPGAVTFAVQVAGLQTVPDSLREARDGADVRMVMANCMVRLLGATLRAEPGIAVLSVPRAD
jgi:signal transduction histidine kinase